MTENKQNKQKRLTRQQLQGRKVKQWSSIWWKWIIIWIWIFFLLLVLIIFFFFFYLTSNPSIWKWIWMWPSTIKSVTSVFAWLLFWSLFIVFLIFWLTYLYKLLTKDIGKIKNWIWTFIIFILWTTNLVFWWIVFSKINNIHTNDIINTTNVLIWNVNFANKTNPWEIKYLPLYKNNFPLIAPIAISFKLNENIFNNTYYNKIKLDEWNIVPIKFEINCWNWEVLEYTNYKFPQNKYCLYLNKWTHNISFKFIYKTKNNNNKELILPWKTIKIASDINFTSLSHLNSNKNEIIVWERTDEVKLDLRKVPSDLWLDKNTIDVSFEWNSKFQTLEWIAKHTYNKDWKYFITLRLPNKSEYPYYIFPIRVNPSTKPTCVINSKENKWTYTFIAIWDSPKGSIKKYNYEIKNISNSETIKKWRWNIIRTKLENGSNYQVIWNITDTKWNVWSCKSSIVKLSSKKDYKYDIKVYDENKNEITYTGNTVIVNTIPKTLTLNIWDIIWWEKNITTIGFDTDLDWNIDKKSKTSDITIKKDTKINTIIKDIYWNTATKTIIFKVEQKKIIAKLNSDTHKWETPLKIKFDASTSKVTEKNDSIVYFQWDFGDGEKLQNTRRWNLEHTYKKAWTYIAKVTVESEKWYKDTATKKIIVYKLINTASIIFPNNLWWQIQAGNSLSINLQTSWNIKDVEWDFGDGKTFSCSWRECMSITHRYEKKWIYRIKAKVSYSDNSPSTTANSSINVIK